MGVGDEALLRRGIAALQRERNEAAAVIAWRFSTQDARSKLKHVYPIELRINSIKWGSDVVVPQVS